MARKYDLISELYDRTAKMVTSNPDAWQAFLRSACYNFRLRFDEQLLVFAQRPDATAVLEIEKWNDRFVRWVNKGAKGIAVFEDADRSRQRLKHYFDISDTHETYYSRPVPIWKMKPEYEADVIATLESTFGELESKSSLEEAIHCAAENAVADNLQDYFDDLIASKDGSLMEELDEATISVEFGRLATNSVAYMIMVRLGLEPDDYFEWEDFADIYNYTTPDTLNAIGLATSDIAEMALSEISKTILSLDRENRTFVNRREGRYNETEIKTERSTEYGNQLHDAGRLSSARPETAGAAGGGAGPLRTDETEVPEGAPQSPVLQSADQGQADRAPVRDGAAGVADGGDPDPTDGGAAGRDREAESRGHDELGSEDEQHQELGAGDRAGGSDLRLSGHDLNVRSKYDYFHQDAEKNELLLNCPALKPYRREIAEHFTEAEDLADRAGYIRSFFTDSAWETTLADGQKAGMQAYSDVLHLWRGTQDGRESEVFMTWKNVASSIYGMILLHKWLESDQAALPSVDEQTAMIEKAGAERTSAFSLPQEAIDYVLARGGGYSEGKMRIYRQFTQSLSASENIAFLKKEYGIGGHSDAIPGSGLWEDHDGKGISISNHGRQEKVLLSWSKVEKRIAELIKLDRYLNPREMELYPQWLTEEEQRIREAEERRANREILSTAPAEKEPTAEAQSHYEYHLGDTVYLGAQEFEILSFDESRVMLYDVAFPLFNREETRADFDRMVAENPMNDHLKVVDAPAIEQNPPALEQSVNVIRLYRVGDFYEMFGEEAEAAAKALDLTLTSREIDGERIPMCGIPYHALERYTDRLALAGYTTPIIDDPDGFRKVRDGERRSLRIATELINSFCQEEYGDDSEADFSDLSKIGIAYTTLSDAEIPIQVNVDLKHYTLSRYLDGKLFDTRSYETLDDLIREELSSLDFTDLTYVDEETLQNFLEQDDFSDIDPAAIRKGLEASGIVNGEVVDPEKLERSPFIQQVMADVTALADQDKPKEPEKLTPAWERKKKKVNTFDLHPDVPMGDRHTFDLASHEVEEVGKKDRFRRNIMAIQLLKKCQEENRFATSEEQVILSKYVGWGGLPEAFEPENSSWETEYLELKSVLTPEEYASARESTLTAFYTPPAVISAIYKAMEQMGFKEGNILEPSCGIGNFMGLLPQSMQNARMYGVEMDTISAGIAQQLYQKTSIAALPYEKADIPDSFFDAVVGNVPFGDFSVADKRYDKNHFLIHDYFFAKSLDKLRPGGIMALVTSKGTMDKENSAVRKYIAQRADLLGAIRLPNNTFKGNAGTEVVSDILILQKRDRLIDIEPNWVHLDTDENGLKMNSYFVQHPEMVLGESKMVSGRYGKELTVIPYDDADLPAQLEEAISNIHGEISEYETDEELTEEDTSIPADPTVRNFSYTVVDDIIYYRENSRMNPVKVSNTAANRIKGMIRIRDAVRNLLEMQTEDYPDEDIRKGQAKLNDLYDRFTAKYGLISSRGNKSAFSQDSSFSLLAALEVTDEDGKLERKADIFTKRTIKPHVPVTSVDTASEALAVSMGERACVDMEYMTSLCGKSEEEIFKELKGVIFLNPAGEPKYLMADEYLSGNVREKLRIAKRSAEVFPELPYQDNIEALEKVQPKDLTASEIYVRLGATWLPTDVVQSFMHELLDTPYYMRFKMQVHYSPYTSEWNIENKSFDRSNVKANTT